LIQFVIHIDPLIIMGHRKPVRRKAKWFDGVYRKHHRFIINTGLMQD
jgi:hypothetical protein